MRTSGAKLKWVLGVDKIPVCGLHRSLAPENPERLTLVVAREQVAVVLRQLVQRGLRPPDHERVPCCHAVVVGVLGHLVRVGDRFRWQQAVHVDQVAHGPVEKPVAGRRFLLGRCHGSRAVAAGRHQSLVQEEVGAGGCCLVAVGDGGLRVDVERVELGQRVEAD